MCLRVISAYCTVSRDAVGVIAGIAPIDLMAKERKRVYQERKNQHRPPADEDTMAEWQGRWQERNMDKWTYRFIPDIKRWTNRRHGEVNLHLTQALSGHGCFAEYLNRFGKLDSPECWYCGYHYDDAFHTVFACDAWHGQRNIAVTFTDSTLEPENMIETMLKSKENWDTINNFILKVISSKEEEERRRQATPP